MCNPGWPGTHYIVKGGLKFATIYLPWSPECRDWRCVPIPGKCIIQMCSINLYIKPNYLGLIPLGLHLLTEISNLHKLFLYVCGYTCMWRLEVTLDVFLSCSSSYFLDRVSLWTWSSLLQLGSLASDPWKFSCFYLPDAGIARLFGDAIQVLRLAWQALSWRSHFPGPKFLLFVLKWNMQGFPYRIKH